VLITSADMGSTVQLLRINHFLESRLRK